MPLPRKGSPRRSNRRSKSRSRSYSPKPSRRRSKSHSRERKRSRSPREKKKHTEKHRSRSRERRRSRSYEERKRSRSKTPQKHRTTRRSPSEERSYPVKRQADSSVKRHGYRSRSPSPAPVKKSKESYRYKSESPKYRSKSSKQRSPSPPRERFIVEPSSTSSSSRKRSDSRSRKDEIDYVTIIDLSPKEKLDKRFQTPEQKLQGPFDFEENITIGIHRGPHHMELDDDVPVNYNFNPKTFVMLHPKKEYKRPIFERDEILAFKHDAILDEEAYVEKRTITVKPTDKKASKWSDQSDYKITIGSDRDGDRRKVQDSGSRSRMSRKSSYDQDVTVRLDPKPDPRYERMYREQKRQDDDSPIDDRIKRNPNDLRYNLMRKSDRDSDRDRDRDRDRGRDKDYSGDRGMMDARSKIQARRYDTQIRSDRRTSESPPRTLDKEKRFQLPDFKNRPVKYLDRLGERVNDEVPVDLQRQWGYCEICRIPINSESQAFAHINGAQHRNKEAEKFGRFYADDEPSTSTSHQITFPQKRLSHDAADDDFHYDDAEPVEPQSKRSKRSDDDADAMATDSKRELAKVKPERPGLKAFKHERPVKLENGCHLWIFGTGEMEQVYDLAKEQSFHQDLNLRQHNITVQWHCKRCMMFDDVLPAIEKLRNRSGRKPDAILLHIGGNDLRMQNVAFERTVEDLLLGINEIFPNVKIIWSQMLPRFTGQANTNRLNQTRDEKDDNIACMLVARGGHYIRYPCIQLRNRKMFDVSEDEDLKMTRFGTEAMLDLLQKALMSIVTRNISVTPSLTNVGPKLNQYISRNLKTVFQPRKQPFFKPSPYFKRKPFH